MTSKRSVSDIKSKLFRPALTSHFEVEIGLPGGGFSNFMKYNNVILSNENLLKLRLLCSEATLPGSNLATLDITGDFYGVTERHAYRRIYDDRIDLSFYVDAQDYFPIRFFETWIKYIVDESMTQQPDKGAGSLDRNYFYRVRYPEGSGKPSAEAGDGYVSEGLKVIKFERDYSQTLEYRFVKSFPISIVSMPVSYDTSSLLKCTVSMTYIRYVLNLGEPSTPTDNNGDNLNTNFNLTPQQLANINSQSFNPNLNLGLDYGSFTTPGGVTFENAAASGNSITFQNAPNLNLL